jgi:hypothetical protein
MELYHPNKVPGGTLNPNFHPSLCRLIGMNVSNGIKETLIFLLGLDVALKWLEFRSFRIFKKKLP